MSSESSSRQGRQLHLGTGVFMSPDCEIDDRGPVAIGDDVVLGPHVLIRAEPDRGVRIGPRAWLGEGARVEPGASIGQGAMICAGTVVEGEVPPHAVFEGNPPQVVWYLK